MNVVARKGNGTGGLGYFAHSDVVPAKTWHSDQATPFEPVVTDDRLYGRGSCDMKGSIAAMLAAAARFESQQLKQPLYFVVTADEEVGFVGAKVVAEQSRQYREMVDGGTKAIIGEPTELQVIHAHKGSIKIMAESIGEEAHSSTTAGKNANLAMIPFLAEMKIIYDETQTDDRWMNSEFDPPTLSLNINIKDSSPAFNVKPDRSTCVVYLRTMPNVDVQPLLDRMKTAATAHGLDISIEKSSDPFYVSTDSEFVVESLAIAGQAKARTVSYGTDGGVFGELTDKIVFGPGSINQAHTVSEFIMLEQLELGTKFYEQMIRRLCCV